ncbi:MAG: hypothetical protein U5K69_15515 [Balneolaceae bacterium]|nr:hypothetical protein [Balneolaceae bacterium]
MAPIEPDWTGGQGFDRLHGASYGRTITMRIPTFTTTMENIREFYNTYYANDVAIAIAGDVKPEEIKIS